MTDLERLDVDLIVEMNHDLCAETGEHSALLDTAGLEAVVERPWSGFGEFEAFPTLFDKAAALLHGLASRQVFENGNKRTAWVAAVTMLDVNGVDIGGVEPSHSDMFVRAAGLDSSLEIGDLAEWFRVTHASHNAPGKTRAGADPEPSFRYEPDASSLAYAVGVRTSHTDAAVVLEFFVNDPAGQPDYVIFQRILTAPETLIELGGILEQRYAAPMS